MIQQTPQGRDDPPPPDALMHRYYFDSILPLKYHFLLHYKYTASLLALAA
jgi:hypothetical protein